MTHPSPGAGGPLVLIVDDNETNRKLARDVLRVAGIRTLEAATGAEAIALAARELPDVILMDLRLPDMDGTCAARRLADDERTARIPVVALSSVPFETGWFDATGFAGHLGKPFVVRTFADEVRSYCGHARP